MNLKHLTLTLLSLAALVVSASSCEFMRRVAGRPSAEQVAQKAAQIDAERIKAARERDSIALVQKLAADRVAAGEYVSQCGMTQVAFESIDRVLKDRPQGRYSIVLGAFSNQANGSLLVDKAVRAGYRAQTLSYYRGQVAVIVGPTDDIVELSDLIRRVRAEAFCPADAWILVVNQ